jgi:hypothetical protein
VLRSGSGSAGALRSGGDSPEPTRTQRWLARLGCGLMAAGVVVVAVFAGLRSIPMLAAGLAAAALTLVAG